MERYAYTAAAVIGKVHFSAHLMAKQAMDEVDLISRLTWFGGYPEIKVADPCIQLLFKRQILGIITKHIVLYRPDENKEEKIKAFYIAWTWNKFQINTCVMDHFTMTFLAKTLNIVARYFTNSF